MRIRNVFLMVLLSAAPAAAQNLSATYQFGDSNVQSTFQRGGINLSVTTQIGSDNFASTVQSGRVNGSSITQRGEGYSQTSVQIGQGNGFSSTQVQTRVTTESSTTVRTGGNGFVSTTGVFEVN